MTTKLNLELELILLEYLKEEQILDVTISNQLINNLIIKLSKNN